MKKMLKLAAVAAVSLVMAACATQPVSRDYTAYRASKPRSILVLPPVSNAPDVDASLSVLSVTTLPLAEAGYYVMPVAPVYETFKQNGITVADDAQNVSTDKLREIFGADAALYITVDKYGSVYQVINSVVIVSAKAKLVDLRTGTTLWQGQAQASSGENQNNGGGLIGMLVTAAVNQVINQVTDRSHQIGNVASQRLLSTGHPVDCCTARTTPGTARIDANECAAVSMRQRIRPVVTGCRRGASGHWRRGRLQAVPVGSYVQATCVLFHA